MTLKEKFDSISCNDCNMPYCDIKCTILSDLELNKLEQIADDYAIGFAKWLVNRYEKDIIFDEYTSKELLEIYKKEKGL